ncbi:dTDP-glucose 4,6-dehydratase [Alphaproteobacteria bacterium]|jgi:dTDP-glucose 4,6-dehydratase|nr:dTDP-glucose 4,6-dehydratase [Alphaproteobacteria bacterium]
MSIVITGGCGFIGSNFVRRWLSFTDELLVNVDKLTYASNKCFSKTNHKNYEFVQLDILDTSELSDVFDRVRPRAVIHLAAETHVDRSIKSTDEFIKANLNGTHSVLKVCLDYYGGLTEAAQSRFRLINVSTDEVYGALGPDAPSFTEDSPIAPNSPYSASKAGADLLVRSFWKTYGLPVVTTRCSNNFGPFQNREKFIPKIIGAIISGEKIPIYGQGRQIRDWLYVEDHVSALIKILELSDPGALFNIGGGIELENIQLARMICSRMAEKLHMESGYFDALISYESDRLGHDFRYSINSNKIHELINWAPTHDFSTSLDYTLDYYLKSSSAC